jgi:nucleoside-triphosphatase
MRLFLTGNPGVGKTTLIRAVVERLEGITSAGFYTEEIRQIGQRTGFRIVTLDGHADHPRILREKTAHSRKIFDPR